MNWILANSKQCPNKGCNRRIERSSGCNHMTCAKCSHHFCWMCLGNWSEHGEKTGGWYKCNRFNEADPETAKRIKEASDGKNELAKYSAAFERYMSNERNEKAARKMLDDMDLRKEQLHEIKQYPANEVEFLTDATNEVVRCR